MHTLRCELGDETFWNGVRDYVTTFAGKAVETDDFRRVLEAHSGRSLVRFFEQWFHTPGYPQLAVTFEYDDKRKEGTFVVEQKQVSEKDGVPLFHMELDLGWVVDGQLQTTSLRVREQKQTMVVKLESDPEQVRVDPHGKVLHKLDFNPGDAKLRTQLTCAKDVVGRIQAAFELAKTGNQQNIQALVDAYENEPFWGVRVRFGNALAEARTPGAVSGLARCIAQEDDPMVLSHVIRASSKYRDPLIRLALEQRLGWVESDKEASPALPYRAAQAAYEALGAQRDDAPIELLLRASERDGFEGIVQSGALRGLGATKSASVLPALLQATVYGNYGLVARCAAISGLAYLGCSLPDQSRPSVVEALVDLLRDPHIRARRAAAQGLEQLGEVEAIPAMLGYRNTITAQEQAELDRWVAAIRKRSKPRVDALTKELEKANDKILKLEERLEKLEARLDLPEA